VGSVIQKGEPQIVLDVSSNLDYYREPLLEKTRSEIVIPLKFGEEMVGALDVQSTALSAFSQEDAHVLQTLADQLAIAIENILLVDRLETALRESNALYQQQMEKAWSFSTLSTRQSSFEYDRIKVKPTTSSIPVDVLEKLRGGQAVVVKHSGNGSASDASPQVKRNSLVVPVMLRDHLIGVIGLEDADPKHKWTEEEIAIAQATANQAALSLENARLVEETQLQAARETMIAEIAGRVRERLDIDSVLKTAVRELGASLDVAEVEVRLGSSAAGSKI
jgi:GAF domain-containing protein